MSVQILWIRNNSSWFFPSSACVCGEKPSSCFPNTYLSVVIKGSHWPRQDYHTIPQKATTPDTWLRHTITKEQNIRNSSQMKIMLDFSDEFIKVVICKRAGVIHMHSGQFNNSFPPTVINTRWWHSDYWPQPLPLLGRTENKSLMVSVC